MNSFFFNVKKTRAVLALLLGGLLALSPSEGAWAAGACSASIGLVTLNEYNYIDNFTEIDRINPSVNLSGWTVTIYTSGKTTVKTLPATGTNTCFGGRYQVSAFASNEIGTNADMVLKDGAGDVVDILRVRTSLPVTTTYYGAKPACSFVASSTDLFVSSGSKGADRLPDGVGDWRQTPGTGNNSFQSRCGPNIVGGNADLSVSKTVNSSSVVKGTAVVFTVLVVNNGIDTASSVLVNDLLPSGFSYVNSTVTAGSYSSSTGVWTIGDMAVNGAATLTLTASTTVVGTLSNTATVASNTFDPATANNTSSVGVIVTSPGATLDAVEAGAAAGTAINTKLAGQSFNLDILALAADASIATSYNKTVTIELVDASSSTTCSTMHQLQLVGTYIYTGSGVGQDNGRKTYTFSYPDAARNVRVRIKDNNVTPITACSTDNFAIRPQSFTVASSNANADAAGLSTVATPVVKAGSAFALTATAVAGYSTTPLVDSSKLAAHTGAVQVGSLGGSFVAAAAGTGVATGSFTYSEVGYFNLAVNGVYDDTFTAVDASPADCTNDFSNTLVGGKYGCKFGNTAATNYFGRFVPDHFALTPGSLIDRSGINTGSSETCASAFTYMGEDFKTIFTLTAQNSVNATTQNYTGGHAIFGLTTWSNFVFSGSSGTLQQGTAAPSGTWGSAVGAYGTAAVTATHTITRPASPTAPHTAFSVSAQPTYTDSTATIALAASTATHAGTSEQRFGRLRLSNAYGSELLDLPIPVQTQFWNGTAFVTNTDDNCTTVASSNIGLSNYQKNLSSGETGVSPATVSFASGIGSMKLTKPGAGNSGSTDLCLDLGPDPGGGTVCSATSANLPFLQGKWPPGTNWNNDPTARATFGIYKSPLIYRRENY